MREEDGCGEAPMTPFDDLPIPRVDPVGRVGAVQRGQRTRAIRLPPGVLPPGGQGLVAAWQRGRNQRKAPAEPEAQEAAIEPDPPETYGEHGELLHPHGPEETERARLDLEA